MAFQPLSALVSTFTDAEAREVADQLRAFEQGGEVQALSMRGHDIIIGLLDEIAAMRQQLYVSLAVPA